MKESIPSRQYEARKDDYDRAIRTRLARVAISENPDHIKQLGSLQQVTPLGSDNSKDSSGNGKDKEIQDFADKHTQGDYNKAEALLKHMGQL